MDSIIVDVATAVGGFAAAVGLGFTYTIIKASKDTTEASMVENIFNDLRDFERDLYDIPKDDIEKKKDWASLFFNTLDWLGFLIINKKIKDKKSICYFKDAVLGWYNEFFLDTNYIEKEQVDDPKDFDHFKALVKRYKDNTY
jgi:hypothetical protein